MCKSIVHPLNFLSRYGFHPSPPVTSSPPGGLAEGGVSDDPLPSHPHGDDQPACLRHPRPAEGVVPARAEGPAGRPGLLHVPDQHGADEEAGRLRHSAG